MPAALKLAGKIAKNAPIAVRNCKKAINDGISLPIEKAVEVEEKLFGDCFETHDQVEGMGCFLSREKAEAETGLHQQLISASRGGSLCAPHPAVLNKNILEQIGRLHTMKVGVIGAGTDGPGHCKGFCTGRGLHRGSVRHQAGVG